MKHFILTILVSVTIAVAIAAPVSGGSAIPCQTTGCECISGYYPIDSPEYTRICDDYTETGAAAGPNYLPVIIPAVVVFSVTLIVVVGLVYSKKKRNKRNQQ